MELERIKNCLLFRDLDSPSLARLRSLLESVQFSRGEVIFREGDHGDHFYGIDSGKVKIHKFVSSYYEEILALIGPGEIFGEMSFIDRTSRSSSAVAVEESRLFYLSRSKFDRLAEEDPALAAEIMKRLSLLICQRIRSTNNKLKDSLLWADEILRLTALSFNSLIQRELEVRISFGRGDPKIGRITAFSKTEDGYDITLRETSGRFYIIPYHAVYGICLEADKVEAGEDSPI